MTNDDAVMGVEELAHEEHALREAESHASVRGVNTVEHYQQ